jgi:hypothetical protein
MKNLKTFQEFVNESVNTSVDPRVKSEAISKLSDFFRVSPNSLSKFNFDGKDNIKELTKALNSTSDKGTEVYYTAAIEMAKKDLGINESDNLNENVSLQDNADFLKKEEKHFAAFLKPKRLDVNFSNGVLTISPASRSFTITVDEKKKTIETTGKPDYPESVSYVEIMEYVRFRTKYTVVGDPGY